MAYQGNSPAAAYTSFAQQTFSIVNSQTSYTLDHPVANGKEILLYINNVKQVEGSGEAYTASGNTLTIASALTNGTDEMYCLFIGKAIQNVVPPSGSVTGAMMSYPLTNFSSTGIDDNADATAITIDSSENVGVGTTSPTRLLTVENSSGNSNLCVKSANTGVSQLMFGDSDSDVIGNIAYNHTSNYMYSEVNGSEAMRINSAREVSIGTTSPKGGAALTCSDATGDHDIPLDLITTTSTQDVLRVYANEGGSGGSAIYILPVRTAGTLRGGIYWNGSSLAYNTSSDYRLKENIVDITDATTRVKQLQPKRFNFITDADTTVDGFVAHEVSSVVPEAITGEKDAADENGNPIYQGIDQAKLVPVLTKALQEAITKIEQLETRIQTLENA